MKEFFSSPLFPLVLAVVGIAYLIVHNHVTAASIRTQLTTITNHLTLSGLVSSLGLGGKVAVAEYKPEPAAQPAPPAAAPAAPAPAAPPAPTPTAPAAATPPAPTPVDTAGPSPTMIIPDGSGLMPWQLPAITYNPTINGPWKDFRATNGMYRRYVDPNGAEVDGRDGVTPIDPKGQIWVAPPK